MDNQTQPSQSKFRFVSIAAAILVVLIGAYFAWANYLSPEAAGRRKMEENVAKYESYINTYEAAMKADIYGGKTPQETLDMFVAALKKEDMDLASKYFALDTNENSPDYLTRKKWESGLIDIRNNNKVSEVISKLGSLKIQEKDDFGNASFQSLDEKGLVDISVNFIFNKYSGVWKIESM